MKYVALIRGINVGGNNLIKMVELKACFEKGGFKNVITYIQSGNVVFEVDEKNNEKIVNKLESALLRTFKVNLRIVVRSYLQLKKVLSGVPGEWRKRDDLRCYIAFVKEPVKASEVVQEVVLKDGIDFVKVGEGVVYMTTLLRGLTKSGFTKLVGKKIYQDITIRNYNTTLKLLALMEQK